MPERTLSPTVYGIETEYSCTITMPGSGTQEIVGACHSFDSKLGLYQQPSRNGMVGISTFMLNEALESIGVYRNESTMLSNGGRLYIDPSGPEYCTPETTTAEEAVHRSFDGDVILFKAFRYLQETGSVDSFQINRRIVDHNRTSRGIHINTATNLPRDMRNDTVQALAALNVAKGALFGSGGLLIDANGQTQFHHSPRLSLTNAVTSSSSSWERRPLIRVPFKSDVGCSRIETLPADALNFAWPMRASMVMTNAVVKLLELRQADSLPFLRNPKRAAQIVGRYGNANQIAITTLDGEHKGVKPVDVLRDIAETAFRVDEKEHFLDSESDQVLGEVIDVADIVSRDPAEAWRHVESIARYEAMLHRISESDKRIRFSSERLCRFDYLWDLVGGGIAEGLREKNRAGWLGFKNQHDGRKTSKRMLEPPVGTRAALRGYLITDTLGGNDSTWYDFLDENGQRHAIAPLQTEFK